MLLSSSPPYNFTLTRHSEPLCRSLLNIIQKKKKFMALRNQTREKAANKNQLHRENYLVGFHFVAFGRDDSERTKPRRRRSHRRKLQRGEPRNALRGTESQRALLVEWGELKGGTRETSRRGGAKWGISETKRHRHGCRSHCSSSLFSNFSLRM